MSNQLTADLAGAMATADFPKASIGNYKGVMLCNRPNEFGQQRAPERTGDTPFQSRVGAADPLGWGKAAKLLPRRARAKKSNAVLARHRAFLSELEQQKQGEIDNKWMEKDDKK